MSSFYSNGSASVEAGGTVVTGTGTMWKAVGVLAGDMFYVGSAAAPIASVDSAAQLTLMIPWQGMDAEDADYVIVYASPERSTAGYLAARVRELVDRARILEATGPFYRVLDVLVNEPPASPTVSDTYVIGEAPTGAWTGYAENLAQWTGDAWSFTPAKGGFLAYSEDDDAVFIYSEGVWAEIGASVTADALAVVDAALETIESAVDAATSTIDGLVDSAEATVAAAIGTVTTARDATLGYRNQAETFKNQAEAAAVNTVRFDIDQSSKTVTEQKRARSNIMVRREFIASQTFSGVTSVSFTNLAEFSQLFGTIRVRYTGSTAPILYWRGSQNNGSTWIGGVGDYQYINDFSVYAGSGSVVTQSGVETAGPITGTTRILDTADVVMLSFHVTGLNRPDRTVVSADGLYYRNTDNVLIGITSRSAQYATHNALQFLIGVVGTTMAGTIELEGFRS